MIASAIAADAQFSAEFLVLGGSRPVIVLDLRRDIFRFGLAMTDRRLWPKDRHSTDGLLRFFLLDKLFDEVEYELSHRPEGLNVPLTGLLRILSNAESEYA